MSSAIHARVLERRAAVERAREEERRREEFLAAARGAKGDTGPMPDHEWKGSKLRFQKPDGSWGEWVDLRGKPGKAGKDGESVVRVVGGSGGMDASAAEIAETIAAGDEMLIVRNGQLMRLQVSLSSVPVNAITVNGEYLMVNGQYVTASN